MISHGHLQQLGGCVMTSRVALDTLFNRTFHPCLCGFRPHTRAAQKRHRRGCQDWKDRPDPRGQAIERLRQTQKAAVLCADCQRVLPYHGPGCPRVEDPRAELIERIGIPKDKFELVLAVLKTRYPNGWKGPS